MFNHAHIARTPNNTYPQATARGTPRPAAAAAAPTYQNNNGRAEGLPDDGTVNYDPRPETKVKPPPPPLPAKPARTPSSSSSSSSSSTNRETPPPPLPPRRESASSFEWPSSTVSSLAITGREEKHVVRVSLWDKKNQSPPPPRLPERPASSVRSQMNSSDTLTSTGSSEGKRVPLKKVAPPPVPADTLRRTGLATWTRTVEEEGQQQQRRDDSPPPRLPEWPSRRPSSGNSSALATASASSRSPSRIHSRDTAISNYDRPPPMPRRPTSTRSTSTVPTRNDTRKHDALSAAPPPVPLASRPNMTKMQGNNPSSSSCLKCRDYSAPDAHAAHFPRQSLPSRDLSWLSYQLTAPFPSLTDKARVIFTWLYHNIAYDTYSFFNNCVKHVNPSGTFATGRAVCQGYAELFETLATAAGLEAKVIGGHGKGIGFLDPAPGSRVLPPFQPNHAWNVVKIDNGRWKLIDACWGAGHVTGHEFRQNFNPLMFTESNDEFGRKHFPSDKDQFYREDGRPCISWEEYLCGSPRHPVTFGDAMKFGIGEYTFKPATERISIHQHVAATAGPIRFEFGLVCPHIKPPGGPAFFVLLVERAGNDSVSWNDCIPFNHIQTSSNGDVWCAEVASLRALGLGPSDKLSVVVLLRFGDRRDPRGLSVEEFMVKRNGVGMQWAAIAQWRLDR